MDTLFAYGTLLDPAVWRAVAGEERPSRPATLPGHLVRRVRGADFPGVIPGDPEDVVPGRIFSGLPPGQISRLDAYEGELYERREVTLLDDGGDPVRSQAYLIADRFRSRLSEEPWTWEWFAERARERYLGDLSG